MPRTIEEAIKSGHNDAGEEVLEEGEPRIVKRAVGEIVKEKIQELPQGEKFDTMQMVEWTGLTRRKVYRGLRWWEKIGLIELKDEWSYKHEWVVK